MYIHPAMATGHTWGCGPTPKSAHILIYWVGPFVGAWLALQVNKRFKLNLYGSSPKKVHWEVRPSKAVTENGPLNDTVKKRKNKRRFFYS